MSHKLPPGWTKTTIAKVTTPVQQQQPVPDERFLYIDISAIDRDKKVIRDPQELEGQNAPSRARQLVAAGDVLVSMTRPNLNAVALVPPELDGQIASTGFDVLRAVGVSSRWIFHIVRSEQFVSAMSELVQGALYPAVRPKDIRNFEIPVAPLNEQLRINEKLDLVLTRIHSCLTRLDAVSTLLKLVRQSVFTAATTGKLTEDWRIDRTKTEQAKADLEFYLNQRREQNGSKFKEPAKPDLTHWTCELPEGWLLASVGQYADCLDSKRIPVKKEQRLKSNAIYPYYGANGLVDRVDDYIFDDELVLVTEDETFYGREKPIAYRTSGKCWVNNHAHVLRAGDIERSDYLCFALSYYHVIPWLTGTTGRAKLTQAVLNSLPIAVPPKEELQEIVKRVRKLLLFCDRVDEQVDRAREMVDQMTPRLFAKALRGELVPQDPSDQPAESLIPKSMVLANPQKIRKQRK
jgi:type I restriction enzyme S subunit